MTLSAFGCLDTRLTTSLRAATSSSTLAPRPTATPTSAPISLHVTQTSAADPSSGCVLTAPSRRAHGLSRAYAGSSPSQSRGSPCVPGEQLPSWRAGLLPTSSKRLADGLPTPSTAMCEKAPSFSKPYLLGAPRFTRTPPNSFSFLPLCSHQALAIGQIRLFQNCISILSFHDTNTINNSSKHPPTTPFF